MRPNIEGRAPKFIFLKKKNNTKKPKGAAVKVVQWPNRNGRRSQSDFTKTKLEKHVCFCFVLFCFLGQWGKRELVSQEQIWVCRWSQETCASQRTMWNGFCASTGPHNDSMFLFFYSLNMCILWNDCTPLFRGFSVFVKIGKTLWLCLVSVNLLLFILKNTPVN